MPLTRGDYGGEQRGLPGVLPEEAALPSEVVLDGGALDRRRREAYAQLRALLVDRPADIPPEEWRVVVATLAPPTAHLPRAPGTPAKAHGVLQAARECFPGLSPSAAVRRFREVQERPAVKAFIADIRALEMLDIVDQRGMVREWLHATGSGAALLYDAELRANPGEWAKVAAAVTAAAKVLVDMDALRQRPEDVAAAAGAGGSATGDADADDAASLAASIAAKVGRVAKDLQARSGGAGQRALIDAVADEVG